MYVGKTNIFGLDVDLVAADLSVLVRVVWRVPPHLDGAGVDRPCEHISWLPRNCEKQMIHVKIDSIKVFKKVGEGGGGPARYDHDHRFNGYFA